MKNKMKKQTISVVNKYSSIALTPTFENLLDRGSIIPLKGGCQKHAEGGEARFLEGYRPVSPFLGGVQTSLNTFWRGIDCFLIF